MTTFGELLRMKRCAAGLSLRELARAAGVDHAFLHRLETGSERPQVLSSTIRALAGVMGCRADDLFVAAGRVPPDVEAYVLGNLPAVRRAMRRAA